MPSNLGIKPLPALGQYRDDLRERVEVARINDFTRGMGIAKRPAERNIHRAVAREDCAVVAATGHAELLGDVVFARELDNAVHVFKRSVVRLMHGSKG